jgi:hypothetical protein
MRRDPVLRRFLPGFARAAALLLSLAIASTAWVAAQTATGKKCAGREGDPDCTLYLIARRCIDTSAPNYCTSCPWPRVGYCPSASTACADTTEVWTGTKIYVVIREKSMCTCPMVTNGVVFPTGAIADVEDPDRPQSIWKFAWDTSSTLLPPEQVALVADPAMIHNESQLHIHILPLDPAKSAALEATPFVVLTDLLQVWGKTDQVAVAKLLTIHGILVHAAGEGQWHAHVENAAMTEAYTLLSSCPKEEDKKKKR